MDEISKFYEPIQKAQEANNAWSAAQAQKAMDYQTQMSNTAHQREVADLKAAGLNPVLSAGGTGASTTSGVAASAGNENVTAMYGLMSKVLTAQMEQAKAMENTAKAVSGASGSYNPTSTSSVNGIEEGSIADGALSLVKDVLKRRLGISGDTVDKIVNGVTSGAYKGEVNQASGSILRDALKNNTRSAKDMLNDPTGYKNDPWYVKLIQSLNPKNNSNKVKEYLASVSNTVKKVGSVYKGNGRGGKFSKSNFK